MPISLQTVLLAVVCCGFAFGCSDPTPDPTKVPRAAAPIDSHPQALPNTQLANKPAEPPPAGDAASGVVASVEIKPWSSGATDDNKVTGVIQFAPTSSELNHAGHFEESADRSARFAHP